MTILTRKNFSFDVDLQEAYKSPDGTMHVVGIASDDEEDRTGDRMSTKAIHSMADEAMRLRLPLLDNHKSTFGFGETHSASATKVQEKGKTVTRLVVDFALKDHYPQSHDLYNEVHSGKGNKQLSIGGFLNLKNKKAVQFEENAAGKIVRVLDDIHLEHIATTRANMAAVPRTKFVSAIIKDVFGTDEDLPVDWQQDAGEKIADAVEDGADSGMVALNDETEVTFDVTTRRSQGSDKREVIVVMVDRNESAKTAGAEPPMAQATENNQTAAGQAAQDSGAGKQEEKNMTVETPKSAEVAAKVVVSKDAPKTEGKPVEKTGDASVAEGLAVLSRIGKAFSPSEEKNELSVEISELTKSWDKVRTAGDLTEKSMEALRRIMTGMTRLLNEEVGDERAQTDSAFALKSEDIDAIAAAVIKGMTPAVVEGAAGVEEDKTNSDVIKTFEGAFTGMTTEVAKGLGEMAEGFKGLVSKEIGEIKTQLEITEKSADERLARLEKAAGVRQSAPAQDAAVATGAQTSDAGTQNASVSKARRPDQSNLFRGVFDGARQKYLSTHR